MVVWLSRMMAFVMNGWREGEARMWSVCVPWALVGGSVCDVVM